MPRATQGAMPREHTISVLCVCMTSLPALLGLSCVLSSLVLKRRPLGRISWQNQNCLRVHCTPHVLTETLRVFRTYGTRRLKYPLVVGRLYPLVPSGYVEVWMALKFSCGSRSPLESDHECSPKMGCLPSTRTFSPPHRTRSPASLHVQSWLALLVDLRPVSEGPGGGSRRGMGGGGIHQGARCGLS